MTCPQQTDSTRLFTFKSSDNVQLRIVIPEVLDPSYGMYVWPSAPVLAQYVWHNREKIKGKYVLELGAGTSLPGVVAAKVGARVTLSDSSKFPACLLNCKKSLEANGLADVCVLGITWGQFTPDLLDLPPTDVILGSDCFYDTKDFEDVLVTVAFLLDKNPQAEFWCTYQERSSDRCLDHLLDKWELHCLHIPLVSFDADSADLAGSRLPGSHTIQMMVITR